MMRLGKWLSRFRVFRRKDEEADPAGVPESCKPHSRFFILAFICLVLTIVGGSHFVFEELKRNETQNVKDNLASIARLKSGQINEWLNQSRATAEIFSNRSQLASATNQWLGSGALPDPTATWLTERLEQIRRLYAFDEVAILNVDGTVLLTTNKSVQKNEHLALIRDVVEQRRILVGQLQWDVRQDGTPFISLPVAAPMIAADAGDEVTGVLLFELDASQFLFPLIQAWPIPSRSAESLLVRRDGDDVQYLNELRHRKGTALTMRIPVAHPTVLASQALRGSSGLLRGTDYRDEPALGYALQVPGTDWVMIAKIDMREAYGPIRQLGKSVDIVVVLMLTIAGLSLYYWWRQRNATWDKHNAQLRAAQLEADLLEQRLSKQFDYLTRYANDIILLMDEDGNVVEANERAISTYGYSRQQLLQKNIRQLRLSLDMSAMERQFERVKESDSLLFVSEHVRSDGSVFPVEVNSRAIRTEHGMFVQSIIRDITDRKLAEEALRKSEARFSLLSETAEALLVTPDPQALVEELCRKVMRHLDCDVFFNFMVDEAAGRLRLNACAGIPEVETWKIEWLDYWVGVCGSVARDRARVIVEDILQTSDDRTELMKSYGVQAFCCHPLVAGERIFGTLGFGTTQRARFSPEDVELMQAVSYQVSVAMERLQREKALQESRAQLSAAVESMTDAVFISDAEGRFVLFNEAAATYHRFGSKEECALTLAEYPDILDVYFDDGEPAPVGQWAVARALSGETAANAIYRVRRKDTGEQWTGSYSFAPIRNQDGAIAGSVVVARDITEQRRAEQALRESEERYRSFVQASSQIVWTANARGEAILDSPVWRAYTGQSEEEAQGFGWMNAILPADRERVAESWRKAFEARTVYEVEYMLRRHDGAWREVLARAVPVLNPDGSIREYVGTCIDITESKLAETMLRESEERLNRAQEMAHLGSWELDLAANALVWSDEVYRIFGLRPQEFGATYDAFLEAVHPDDREAVSEAYESSLREGKDSYEIEHRVVRRSTGEVRHVLEKCAHFRDENGEIIRSVGMVHDITDRKQFEYLLLDSNVALKQAKMVAEKANLAKSDFLSSMSHELRTPLNAVLGFAQLMASDTPPPTTKQMKSIDQILRAGWYLLRLINEILDLATIESGKVTISKETLSLAEELQICRAMVDPQASQRGIQITFDTSDIPCHVTADRTRVKQVIINLLTNAIKYNRPGGSITVRCITAGNNTVRVEVADTGIGLTPEQMEDLFQPFNRLGQESGSEEGTGIGLFVSKQLIELMGGSIGVESQAGAGSVFWFELPLSGMPDSDAEENGDFAMAAENRAHRSSLSPRTLLYVEDNPANLALVEQLIARHDDLKLLTANNGREGVRMACELKPDVILMDINLPGLDGYAAMELLRENPKTAHIPIMALSASALPGDIERGLEAGFFRYLTKPIKVAEFLDALDAALRLTAREAVASRSG